MALHEPNVERMLRKMSGAQWARWRAYLGLSGLPSRRMETYLARLMATIVNVQIGKYTKKGETPQYMDTRSFLIPFGDTPEFIGDEPTRNQTPREQMSIIVEALGGALDNNRL